MARLVITEEWEVGSLRVRLCVCPRGIGSACASALRVLVGEREKPETDWLTAAYVPREDEQYDASVRRDLEDRDVQETLLQGIALVGTSWPVDCWSADETAKAFDSAPGWMLSVPTGQVRAIREWCWGVDWLKVPAALRELRYCTTIFDRPVKPGVFRG